MKANKRYIGLVMLLTGSFCITTAQAAIWKCVDATGKVQYQQQPCPSSVSNAHPLEVSEINADNAIKTMDLFGKAVIDNDVRAQLAFFSDDFEYGLYNNADFAYPFQTMDKAQINSVLSLLNGLVIFKKGGKDIKLKVVESPAPNVFIVVPDLPTSTKKDYQKLEFIVENGRMLFRRWGVIKHR